MQIQTPKNVYQYVTHQTECIHTLLQINVFDNAQSPTEVTLQI